MSRGKEISAEVAEVVVQLKSYFDTEKRCIGVEKDSYERTAAALGIGVATVKRTLARYNRTGTVVPNTRKHPGRKPNDSVEGVQGLVRDFVRGQNLIGRRVSIEKLRSHLRDEHEIEVEKTTLWRGLNRWGFTFGVGRRRDSLREQDYVIHARRQYLREIRGNRGPDGMPIRPEVYLDETFINKNHSQQATWYAEEDGPWVNKPSGVGPRLIIAHAITQNGWVEEAQLCFEAKKRSGDYHGQMNWENFSTWFIQCLLPKLPPNSLIIMDNAGYHNTLAEDRFPRSSSTVEELKDWLSRNQYPSRDDMLRSELFEQCAKLAPVPEFRLDRIAAAVGHKILRTPQYHCDLQPIECCWAVVKNYMADHCDFSMKGLRQNLPLAFAKVTAHTCAKVIAKVREKEDQYWLEDAELDAVFEKDKKEESRTNTISS